MDHNWMHPALVLLGGLGAIFGCLVGMWALELWHKRGEPTS